MRSLSWQTALVNGIALGTIVLGWTTAAVAQRRPVADDTLGVESSTVIPLDPQSLSDRIEGGAQRGNNLFHSFREFHVDRGRSVYFADPGVDNILARVTGGVESQILGVLGVLGDANLFLLNPSGIIFGGNARLDVRGSFVATTADAIAFPSGDVFSATNPTAPTPLLSVNPSALLFNQLNPQPIINRSIADATGLTTAPGQTLALVGGDVRLENGRLTALGGRVELGGLSEPGTIGLTMNGDSPHLTFPVNVARSDVSLANGSLVDVSAGGGGSIAITTRNLNLNGSIINAGIALGLGTVDSQAGDVEINATGSIAAVSSVINNNIRTESTGQGGNIRISTGSLSLTNGAQLSASTSGRGDAGSIFINARDTVSLDGATADGNFSSAIFSAVRQGSIGRGGGIRISTRSLSLTNGAGLSASTFGRGDAGSVFINARDAVFLDGTTAFSAVQQSGIGRGGDIRITTGSLSLTNGAQLVTGTLGRGSAGSVFINARDAVSFDGTTADGNFSSGVNSAVEESGIGQGGAIRITTGSLSLTNGAGLSTGTLGRGDAGSIFINARDAVSFDDTTAFSAVAGSGIGRGGDIRITTRSLSLTNGAQLAASTLGRGNAGSVFINARDTVSLDGATADGSFSSGVLSTVTESSIGRGGDIRITTGSLSLTNGAQLATSTFGRGDAGSVFINARDTVSLDGTTADDSLLSAVASTVTESGIGRGGNIRITTGSLSLTNSAVLSASTFGRGDAGNVSVNARGSISFDGRSRNGEFVSGVFSNVGLTAIGEGGNINLLTADSLTLTDGAELSASSFGTGGAGNIRANVPQVQLDQGGITSETTSGDGGNIDLMVQNILLLRRGSLISTTAGTARAGGNGGNININAGFIVAVPNENSDIRANAFSGSGGNVRITTEGLFGIAPQPQDNPLTSDITASSELGVQGTVDITSPDVDLRRGLPELPAEVVDASDQIAQTCSGAGVGESEGEFIVTGRGGLPSAPTDSLIGEESLTSWSTLDESEADEPETAVTSRFPEGVVASPNQETDGAGAIVEAQEWIVAEDGTVRLIAAAPASAVQTSATCQSPEN